MPEELSVIDSVPVVPIETDQSPDAEHELALVEDHVRVKPVFV